MQHDFAEAPPKNPSKKKPISEYVDQELLKQLMECGFCKTVSEKSLYLTGNASFELAMEWIETHQQEPGYEEELLIEE